MKSGILREESGQGMVEYGLILVLISLAVIGVLGGMGSGPVKKMYEVEGQKILDVFK